MRVLIIGSGAREHAISEAYEKSNKVNSIVVSPGNDFIGFNRKKEVIIDKKSSLKDPQSILEIAKKYKPDLVDIAQDDALALGSVDLLKENGFKVFGPSKNAARIEGDKKWSREFMQRNNIPGPSYKYFGNEQEAKDYVKQLDSNLIFIKATGLAAGKGALKATNLEEAYHAIEKMKSFGEAGKTFLIEEGLIGEEFSCYAISDGKSFKIMKSAQDNKLVFNFDKGDQTGGMGAICPAKVTDNLKEKIEDTQIARAINGMNDENNPYCGILYLGGINVNGEPLNIEYNARWGDPECQVILPGITTDYVDIVEACLNQTLNEVNIEQDDKVRVCVIAASRGYPNKYEKGKQIFGLEKAMNTEGVKVYGAGIKIENGKFYSNGGRLFSVVGEGNNILEARQKAYAAMAHITIEGNNLHYRTDIGWRDIERELNKN